MSFKNNFAFYVPVAAVDGVRQAIRFDPDHARDAEGALIMKSAVHAALRGFAQGTADIEAGVEKFAGTLDDRGGVFEMRITDTAVWRKVAANMLHGLAITGHISKSGSELFFIDSARLVDSAADFDKQFRSEKGVSEVSTETDFRKANSRGQRHVGMPSGYVDKASSLSPARRGAPSNPAADPAQQRRFSPAPTAEVPRAGVDVAELARRNELLQTIGTHLGNAAARHKNDPDLVAAGTAVAEMMSLTPAGRASAANNDGVQEDLEGEIAEQLRGADKAERGANFRKALEISRAHPQVIGAR
ncbi:MAG TPA: hypothetical protein VNF29_05015 [Candidatus Binataceae bacterium]|nr:hypothetical protein [Candidatus Binataceae bacterium]HVA80264.1 hypothetical protein [Candidatus Binataceae bacterium]